jgi:pimeloyl-ACP methyl ester carboxylesterase
MKLYYRKYGEGQPVIILHGLFGISDNWATIGRRISEKFEVYMVDLRNHGRSPHSDIFNFPAMMSDLEEFIDDHGLENIILLGHSMGGKVAMHFALEYPDLVDKLIVVDISMRHYAARQEHLRMIEAMRSLDFSKVKTRNEVEDKIAETISSERIRLFILKNLHRKNRDQFGWRLNLDSIHENIHYIFEGVESYGKYDRDTLFVRGGKSDYIIDEDYEKIYKHFPNALIETIPQASHWIHAEAPDELCSIFSHFLRKECDLNGD